MRKNNGIRYIVQEDKKIVIAKFCKDSNENDMNHWANMFYDVIHKIERDVEGFDGYYYISRFWLEENASEHYLKQLSNGFYGIAKCHNKDKFDIEIGKEIARKKLLSKYYRFERHMLMSANKYLIQNFKSYIEKIDKRMDLCEHKIKANSIKKE